MLKVHANQHVTFNWPTFTKGSNEVSETFASSLTCLFDVWKLAVFSAISSTEFGKQNTQQLTTLCGGA